MAIDDDLPTFNSAEAASQYWESLARDLDSELESTRDALEEYQASSKELEAELERDLETRERREAELQSALERLQAELEGWRSKYQATLKEHSHTLSHVTRELDGVRKSEEAYRTRVRDMELDNDDLEKSERAMGSTLSDLESRYGKAIERTALLEDELVSKARLEEEVQRLKDELRDMNEEMAVMQEQLASRPAAQLPQGRDSVTESTTTHADSPVESNSDTPRRTVPVKRTSGIPRSTSAQGMNASGSGRSSAVVSPQSQSQSQSLLPTTGTLRDLSSMAQSPPSSSKVRAAISPGVAVRQRTYSRAPPTTPSSAAQSRPPPRGMASRIHDWTAERRQKVSSRASSGGSSLPTPTPASAKVATRRAMVGPGSTSTGPPLTPRASMGRRSVRDIDSPLDIRRPMTPHRMRPRTPSSSVPRPPSRARTPSRPTTPSSAARRPGTGTGTALPMPRSVSTTRIPPPASISGGGHRRRQSTAGGKLQSYSQSHSQTRYAVGQGEAEKEEEEERW